MSNERQIDCVYSDPLDAIWLATAERLGMRVQRADDVFASWDGRGTLRICKSEHMDADDCLAQMIFHEICHALVAGSQAKTQLDWGLFDRNDPLHEHATNRLQAALAERYGLRRVLATTTSFRAYYDALPEDPLAPGDDPAIELAIEAWGRSRTGPWATALERALERTAQIASMLIDCVPTDSLWAQAERLHASGFVEHPDARRSCGSCVWLHSTQAGQRCRQAEQFGRANTTILEGDRACKRWEAHFDDRSCSSCGACCRDAFHRVDLTATDTIRQLRPEWVRGEPSDPHLPRPEGRCPALIGEGTARAAYRCSVYDSRPEHCREFEVAGDACLTARRRLKRQSG